MDTNDLRQEAAFYTVDTYVSSGMQLALGADLTIPYVIERLKQNLAKGLLHDIVVVTTSPYIADIAMENGLFPVAFEKVMYLDLYLGGAEEIDIDFNHIIGINSTPFREKMALISSQGVIVMATEKTLVDHLGTHASLPVEVLPFGWNKHKDWLTNLGLDSKLRQNQDGIPFVTQDGNYIYDCFLSMDKQHDLFKLEWDIERRLGVVTSGLFLYGRKYEMHRIVVSTKNNGIRDMHLEID